METTPSLCHACHERLTTLIDDWNHLCDVLRLDEIDRLNGYVLAVFEAHNRCREAQHVVGRPTT